jgi:hypothetical protein
VDPARRTVRAPRLSSNQLGKADSDRLNHSSGRLHRSSGLDRSLAGPRIVCGCDHESSMELDGLAVPIPARDRHPPSSVVIDLMVSVTSVPALLRALLRTDEAGLRPIVVCPTALAKTSPQSNACSLGGCSSQWTWANRLHLVKCHQRRAYPPP